MLGGYFTPLAPAVILLLSAFVLPILMPRLPANWPARQKVRRFGAAGMVGLAILSLLGIRLTLGSDSAGQGLELLSGWNFSTTESVAALVIRADNLSLPFLVAALLALLSVALLYAAPDETASETRHWIRVAGWLALGATVCLLFVSANGLTLVYAAAFFDIVTAFYWLRRGYSNLAAARLFLALFTAASLMMANLANDNASPLLLGLALWLRLGLYPFAEATLHNRWRNQDRLGYLALSLAVGIYLTIRAASQPMPQLIVWLTAITLLFSGLLTWLWAARAGHSENNRTQLLVWVILAESLLILLAGPLDTAPAIAFGVGLVLSLVALWVTPALGKPRFGDAAWSWPYFPALFATLNLIGLPLWLGWPAQTAIYSAIFNAHSLGVALAAILGTGLAFSGLVHYWLILWQGNESNSMRSVVGVIAMTPFLIPGLGVFILATITQTNLSPVDAETAVGGIIALIAIAGATYYFRDWLLSYLKLPVEMMIEIVSLRWLFGWLEALLNGVGKIVLRIRVTLEGQHYMGWAFFVALVGTLVLLLR